MMMRLPIFGIKKLAFQKSGYNVAEWKITFGLWAFLDHVDLVLKFIMIADRNTVEMVDQLLMKIAIWKFGI